MEGVASMSRDDSQIRSTAGSNLQPLASTVRAGADVDAGRTAHGKERSGRRGYCDGNAGRTVEIGDETSVQL